MPSSSLPQLRWGPSLSPRQPAEAAGKGPGSETGMHKNSGKTKGSTDQRRSDGGGVACTGTWRPASPRRRLTTDAAEAQADQRRARFRPLPSRVTCPPTISSGPTNFFLEAPFSGGKRLAPHLRWGAGFLPHGCQNPVPRRPLCRCRLARMSHPLEWDENGGRCTARGVPARILETELAQLEGPPLAVLQALEGLMLWRAPTLSPLKTKRAAWKRVGGKMLSVDEGNVVDVGMMQKGNAVLELG